MKTTVIVLLVCLNVGLLGTLVFQAMPQANAQASGTAAQAVRPNYLMITGHVEQNEDAIYIIDVNSGKMLGWEFDHDNRRLEQIRLGRDLTKDFRR